MVLLAAPGEVEVCRHGAQGLRGLMRKSPRDHKSSLASELAHIAEETWGIRVRVSDTRGVLKLTDSRVPCGGDLTCAPSPGSDILTDELGV